MNMITIKASHIIMTMWLSQLQCTVVVGLFSIVDVAYYMLMIWMIGSLIIYLHIMWPYWLPWGTWVWDGWSKVAVQGYTLGSNLCIAPLCIV